MDKMEIAVVNGGIFLIAFVLWYFFGEREPPAERTSDGNDDGDATET